jgi:hypothetical protein
MKVPTHLPDLSSLFTVTEINDTNKNTKSVPGSW